MHVLYFSQTLCRLRVYRLAVSHTFLYKKLDEFGEKHNANILEKVVLRKERKWKQKLLSNLITLTLNKMYII